MIMVMFYGQDDWIYNTKTCLRTQEINSKQIIPFRDIKGNRYIYKHSYNIYLINTMNRQPIYYAINKQPNAQLFF